MHVEAATWMSTSPRPPALELLALPSKQEAASSLLKRKWHILYSDCQIPGQMDFNKDLNNAIDTVKALFEENPGIVAEYQRLLEALHHSLKQLGFCSWTVSLATSHNAARRQFEDKRKRDVNDHATISMRRRHEDQEARPDRTDRSTGIGNSIMHESPPRRGERSNCIAGTTDAVVHEARSASGEIVSPVNGGGEPAVHEASPAPGMVLPMPKKPEDKFADSLYAVVISNIQIVSANPERVSQLWVEAVKTASDLPPISFLRNVFALRLADMDRFVQHATAIGMLTCLRRLYEAFHRENFRPYKPGECASRGRPSSKEEFLPRFAAAWHIFDKCTLNKALKVATKLERISSQSKEARGILLLLMGELTILEKVPDRFISHFTSLCLADERVRREATSLSAVLSRINESLNTLISFRWSPKRDDSPSMEHFFAGADLVAIGVDVGTDSNRSLMIPAAGSQLPPLAENEVAYDQQQSLDHLLDAESDNEESEVQADRIQPMNAASSAVIFDGVHGEPNLPAHGGLGREKPASAVIPFLASEGEPSKSPVSQAKDVARPHGSRRPYVIDPPRHQSSKRKLSDDPGVIRRSTTSITLQYPYAMDDVITALIQGPSPECSVRYVGKTLTEVIYYSPGADGERARDMSSYVSEKGNHTFYEPFQNGSIISLSLLASDKISSGIHRIVIGYPNQRGHGNSLRLLEAIPDGLIELPRFSVTGWVDGFNKTVKKSRVGEEAVMMRAAERPQRALEQPPLQAQSFHEADDAEETSTDAADLTK